MNEMERRSAKREPSEGEPEDIFGCLKGEIEIVGDIMTAALPLEDWEVLR
jgi:hypothetical protein